MTGTSRNIWGRGAGVDLPKLGHHNISTLLLFALTEFHASLFNLSPSLPMLCNGCKIAVKSMVVKLL